MKSTLKWAATAAAIMAVAIAVFAGTASGPTATEAAGPEGTLFDIEINDGTSGPGIVGTAVGVKVAITIDGAGPPPQDHGFFDLTRNESAAIENEPGPGMPGGPVAGAIGAATGEIAFTLKTNVRAALAGNDNLNADGYAPQCYQDGTEIAPGGTFFVHLGNMTREAGHTAAGLPTGLFASSTPAFVIGEYDDDGSAGGAALENTKFVQTYDDDDNSGAADSTEPVIPARDEPTGPFVGNPHPFAFGGAKDEYFASGQPQTQEDYDDDGKPNGVEYMPDFLPPLAKSLGLRAFWTSRSYGIADALPGLTSPTDVHFMGFQGTVAGGITFTVLANPFSPPNPATQTTVTCSPFTTTVDLDALTTDKPFCTLVLGCTPLGTTAGTAVAKVTIAGASQLRIFISDDDDFDKDGNVGSRDKCDYDPDNTDGDGDMTAGRCDRDGAEYRNSYFTAAGLSSALLTSVGADRSGSKDNDGSGAVDIGTSIDNPGAGIVTNTAPCDTAGNGICDNDVDDDNWINNLDNCPTVFNALQEDNDGDGVGDEPGCDNFVTIDQNPDPDQAAGVGDGTATQLAEDGTDIDNDLLCPDPYTGGATLELLGDNAGNPCGDVADSSDDAILNALSTISDEDGDGTVDSADGAGGATALQPLVGGTAPYSTDYDRDGCTNATDLMPLNYWNNMDFVDEGAPREVSLSEAIAALGLFGAAFDAPGAQIIDRAIPNAAVPGVVIEASDGIDLTDAINALANFGAGCGPTASAPQPAPGEGEYVARP